MVVLWFYLAVEYAQTTSKQFGIHLALSALSSLQVQATNQSQEGQKPDFAVVGGVDCRGEGNPSRWCRFV
jgi:hypothetical protein